MNRIFTENLDSVENRNLMPELNPNSRQNAAFCEIMLEVRKNWKPLVIHVARRH
jgi:hypothetical protein